VKIGHVDPEIYNLSLFISLKMRGCTRSYWTEVHQIYVQYSHIIADEPIKIRMAILQSISEFKGYE